MRGGAGRGGTGGWRERLERAWYQGGPGSLLLAPAGWGYAALMRARALGYRVGVLGAGRVAVPTVVIGNLAVGGTGKTPLSVWVTERLAAAGYRPGLVCRGYRGAARDWPQAVAADGDPYLVGDEAVLLARRTGCPVIADPDRLRAATRLVSERGCDVVVSDDGLQHLALGRDLEVVVIDGERRHGTGRCLPAGPLREPLSRLARADLVVVKAPAARGEIEMRLVAGEAVALAGGGRRRALAELRGTRVHAVAGIGRPEGFFAMLEGRGIEVERHPFPDHHRFRPAEITFGDRRPVLMTEKDAVKCEAFAGSEHWFVPVEAVLPEGFADALLALVGEARERLARPSRAGAAA